MYQCDRGDGSIGTGGVAGLERGAIEIGETTTGVAFVRTDMDKNVGGVDRTLRIVVGIALLLFGYRNRDRTVGTLAFVAGSDVFATAIIQRCPANALLGIDTCGGDR